MNYLLTPLDQHFDLGFGSVANSFKHAADSVLSSQSESPSLNAHLPASFLYRHSIELFLKSGIIIFHRKFQIPFDQEPFDGEPKVVVGTKWKPMYSVHGVQDLYTYFRSLLSGHAEYLEKHTSTNWEFPPELDGWVSEIEATDSTSTFFRYPVTKHKTQDANKSVHRESNVDKVLSQLEKGAKPVKVFLVVGASDEILKTFTFNDELAKAMTSILRDTANLFYGCHAALRGELTGGW
ncbi:hypothetical protein [Zoogloea sp.]|uniref:hypothetical protein n=1 Tax=Zoogloea sp. TaxID=49181 RepID=UPI0035AECABC